jgi:hypothetical protein
MPEIIAAAARAGITLVHADFFVMPPADAEPDEPERKAS